MAAEEYSAMEGSPSGRVGPAPRRCLGGCLTRRWQIGLGEWRMSRTWSAERLRSGRSPTNHEQRACDGRNAHRTDPLAVTDNVHRSLRSYFTTKRAKHRLSSDIRNSEIWRAGNRKSEVVQRRAQSLSRARAAFGFGQPRSEIVEVKPQRRLIREHPRCLEHPRQMLGTFNAYPSPVSRDSRNTVVPMGRAPAETAPPASRPRLQRGEENRAVARNPQAGVVAMK